MIASMICAGLLPVYNQYLQADNFVVQIDRAGICVECMVDWVHTALSEKRVRFGPHLGMCTNRQQVLSWNSGYLTRPALHCSAEQGSRLFGAGQKLREAGEPDPSLPWAVQLLWQLLWLCHQGHGGWLAVQQGPAPPVTAPF